MRAACTAIARDTLPPLDPHLATHRYALFFNSLQQASSFNQPLSFDTSRVTTMTQMFYVRSAPCSALPIYSRARPCTLLAPRSPATSRPPAFAPRPAPYGMRPSFDSRQSALVFNQPMSFDTSSVTTMGHMFLVRSSPFPAPNLQSSPSLRAACTAIARATLPPPDPHLAPHRYALF